MNAQTKIETSLAASLVAALAEIEGATKDKVNPAFKSKYADLASVTDAIKPVLARHGLGFTQHPEPSEDGVMVETVLHHVGGDRLSMGRLYVPANKKDAQGFGSALTYARRYALMTAFGVPAEDDDGNAAAKSVANNNGLKEQLRESVRQTTKRDLPFPQGPAKNLTELKALGRTFWKDVEACGDDDELSALLATNAGLVKQIRDALPSWWEGYERDGNTFPGLGEVITNRQTEFANEAWKRNPVAAG